MDLLTPTPFWPVRDGLPHVYPSLSSDEKATVVVIGAGITGALVAQRLAKAGEDVVVLDQREVAHGSTAGSTSLLQYEIDTPLHQLIERRGRDAGVMAYQDCRDAIDEVAARVSGEEAAVGFDWKGSLQLASEQAHVAGLRREFEARVAAGFKVDWWSREYLSEHTSLPQPAGLFSHRGEAAQVDAYALAHRLLDRARAAGARIYDRTAVTRWQQTARGVVLQTDREAEVRARWAVVATGYEIDKFLPQRVMDLHSTYALVTEPFAAFPGWPEGQPLLWETRQPYLYLRTTAEGRILIGGYDEPFRDPAKRDELLSRKRGLLLRRLRQLFPDLATVEAAWSWCGTFGETKDGLPYIGRHLSRPRCWFALGYGGNGITYSVLAARLFHERLRGEPDLAREKLYGFDRD